MTGSPQTRKPVVLVAEDEWLLREDIVEELERAELTVIAAASAEAAMEVLHGGQQIDAIVTDIQLGGKLNGWDIAEAFRSADPNVPVVYVSGTEPNPARIVPRGMFIPKPYQATRVVEIVRRLIDA